MHTLMCQLYQQGLWVLKAYELRFWLHSANHQPQYAAPHHILASGPYFEFFCPYIHVGDKSYYLQNHNYYTQIFVAMLQQELVWAGVAFVHGPDVKSRTVLDIDKMLTLLEKPRSVARSAALFSIGLFVSKTAKASKAKLDYPALILDFAQRLHNLRLLTAADPVQHAPLNPAPQLKAVLMIEIAPSSSPKPE